MHTPHATLHRGAIVTVHWFHTINRGGLPGSRWLCGQV
jgi:hypothetical protein